MTSKGSSSSIIIIVASAAVAVGFVAGSITMKLLQSVKKQKRVEDMVKLAEREAKSGCGGDVNIPVRSSSCDDNKQRYFGISSHDTALVIIDMQTDFLSSDGRLGCKYSKDVILRLQPTVTNVERLLCAARKAGLTIAHSRSHRYGALIRRDLAEKTNPIDEGYNIIPSLLPTKNEIVVDKWTFGAFASTDLEEQLRKRGVRKILLAGILTNVCIFSTAVQAVDRLFRVCLAEDCSNAFQQDWHDQGVNLLNGPQISPGHAERAVGLYFGEVATLDNIEKALKEIESLKK